MIYWSINSIPELKGLDKKEQRRLFRASCNQGRQAMGSEFWIRIAILVVVLVVSIAIPIGMGLLWPMWPEVKFLLRLALSLLTGISAVLIIQTPMIEEGRLWLQKQGYPKG